MLYSFPHTQFPHLTKEQLQLYESERMTKEEDVIRVGRSEKQTLKEEIRLKGYDGRVTQRDTTELRREPKGMREIESVCVIQTN